MGIDYGMGKTNIDNETGIRYGVVSINEVTQAWCDESEAQYGQPCCSECGEELQTWEGIVNEFKETIGVQEGKEFDLEVKIDGEEQTAEHWCSSCGEGYDDLYDCYPEEPHCFTYDDGGYNAEQSGDSPDIFIFKSPYYTWCDFCSPCAPWCGLFDELQDHRR